MLVRVWRRWWGWSPKKKFFVTLLAGFLGIAMLYGIAYALAPIPKTTDVATAQSTIVMDFKNRPIARLHAEVDRTDIGFEQR